jgi:hypothetical protein
MFTKACFSRRLEGSRFGVNLVSLVMFVSVLVQPERVRTSGSRETTQRFAAVADRVITNRNLSAKHHAG